jgi:hypothetical protein
MDCWYSNAVQSQKFSLTTKTVYTDLHEIARDVEPELLDEGIIVDVRLAHEVVDLALPVRGGAGRRLDHRGGLHVRELLDAALALHDVAHLQRQVRVLVLLPHLT